MEPQSAPPIVPVAYISNPLELLKPTWQAFKQCWLNLLLLILSLLGSVIAVALLGLFSLSTPLGIIVFLLVILPALGYLISYFSWALTKTTIAAARGEKLTFKATLPPALDLPIKYLLTSLLVGLAIIGGFILLVIPGFFFMSRYSTAIFVLVDEGIWGSAALRRSAELSRNHRWDVLGALMLPSVFSILSIVPIIGPLANFIIGIVLAPLFSIRYTQLVDLEKQPAKEPTPTSSWNYAIFIVALVLGGAVNAAYIIHATQQSASLEKSSQSY